MPEVLARVDGVAWRRTSHHLVAAPAGGELVSVDGLGAVVWDALAVPVERERLAADLAAAFDVTPVEAAARLDEVVDVLVRGGLVRRT